MIRNTGTRKQDRHIDISMLQQPKGLLLERRWQAACLLQIEIHIIETLSTTY